MKYAYRIDTPMEFLPEDVWGVSFEDAMDEAENMAETCRRTSLIFSTMATERHCLAGKSKL